MTLKKKESALGRGLDALIKPEINKDKQIKTRLKQDNSSKTLKTNIKTSKTTKKDKKTKNITVKNGEKIFSVDNTLIENVILEVHKNPRISLWSAKSAAVLRLLKKTQPEFSISKEASVFIEEAVKTKYPDIWEIFEKKKI
ncbi:MAG: AAA family ATPase [Methanobacterium sp.]|nr:AAA family ATPase [Methanobacterium sp.]